MRQIKSRGIIIGEQKFQLINSNGIHSREFNVVQTSKKEITDTNKNAKKDGIVNTWIKQHHGTEKCIKRSSTRGYELFLKFMKNKKDPKLLVIGPATGYEVKYLKEHLENSKINTIDLKDEISEEYKKLIEKNGTFIAPNGLENLNKKSLIGKYDGITAMYSIGWHVKEENLYRNLFKTATMLKPGGVAVIRMRPGYEHEIFENLLQKLHLENHFRIFLDPVYNNHVIIKRK